jgi:hypothetical protein
MYASMSLQYALGVDIFTSYYSEQQAEPALYKQINESLGRADMIMRGRHKANVMLYYPIETFQMHHKGSAAFYGEYCAEENACAEGLRALFYGLLDHQMLFDFTDCDYLEKCRGENGFLVTPQDQYYSVLVLPPMELTDRLASILQRLASQGLTILAPQHELFPALSNVKFATLAQNAADLIGLIPTDEFSCHACTPVSGVVCKFATRMGGARFLFANAEEKEQVCEVVLRGTLREPVLYSPLRDAVEPAEFARIDERTVRAKFKIEPLETVIVLGKENIQ